MTRSELIDAVVNAEEELDMANAYYPLLANHLRKRHRCKHDFVAIAEEPDAATE